jgi:hypothetical protein
VRLDKRLGILPMVAKTPDSHLGQPGHVYPVLGPLVVPADVIEVSSAAGGERSLRRSPRVPKPACRRQDLVKDAVQMPVRARRDEVSSVGADDLAEVNGIASSGAP